MQDGTDKREIKNRSLIVYLNGNKHTQVTNNSLQYFHPSNQTTTVAVDKVVDQTSGIQDVIISATDNFTILSIHLTLPQTLQMILQNSSSD